MFAKKQMPIFAYRYDLQIYRLYVEYGEEMHDLTYDNMKEKKCNKKLIIKEVSNG